MKPSGIIFLLIAAAAAYYGYTLYAAANLPEVGDSDMTYLEKFKLWAATADLRGIPWQMAFAQSALETGRGTSSLALNHNALFAIKSSFKASGAAITNDYWEGAVSGSFRAYSSPVKSIGDWARLIATSNTYSKAYKYAKAGDYVAFFTALIAAGYSTTDTDTYAKSCASLYKEALAA